MRDFTGLVPDSHCRPVLTHQLVRCSSAESGVSVPPSVHWLEHGPICQQTLGKSIKQSVCSFDSPSRWAPEQSYNSRAPEGNQSFIVISG